MAKNSFITVKDQFCGCGGSSQGVRNVARKMGGGIEVKIAMNHWKLAIETHNTNFPETDHVCANISNSDPRRYPSTDMLITSPECTVHSPAGGGQGKKKIYGNQLALSGKLASEEAEDRSRATMWDVPRFAEYHRYNLIIVENVIEARKWELFDIWLMTMIKLGYDHEIKYINSMHHHPTPQSRDRMYIVFWKKGNKKPDLSFHPVAPCNKCLKNVEAYQWFKEKPKNSTMPREHGKYRTQYLFKCPECNEVVEPYFYAALNCIDWSKPGTRIGDRKVPLKPNTTARCEYAIDKYWDEPTFINVKFSSGIGFRVKPAAGEPLTTQPGDQAIGVLRPCIISSRYITGLASRVRESDSALPVQPILIKNYSGKQKPILPGEALGAVTGQDHHGVLNTPLVIENYGQSSGRPAEEAITAQQTKPKHGIITDRAFNSLISYYYGGSNVATHITETMRTVATKERAILINQPYEKPKLEDCFYRMLLPHEIQIGMAFDEDYIVLGDSKQKVKQLGNAVTPPVMEFLVQRCIDSLR
jgi:DNA (cytosine-5)-methyltransferase 1